MNEGVREWLGSIDGAEISMSVLVVGEIRHGIELGRRRDPDAARSLDGWLDALLRSFDRILPVDTAVIEVWARMGVPDPVPVIDGLVAATAIVHGLTVVTRNERDFRRTGARVLNPFVSG